MKRVFKMDKLVSVVIPVYNVEKLISRCVDSVLNQTYKNLEIILVDDGSPDNSVEVIDGYIEKYQNIKLINQPNLGVCVARNTGFENAVGKYVWFVDPDDYIAPNCLGGILSALDENNADLITFDYFNVLEESEFNPQKQIKIDIKNNFNRK